MTAPCAPESIIRTERVGVAREMFRRASRRCVSPLPAIGSRESMPGTRVPLAATQIPANRPPLEPEIANRAIDRGSRCCFPGERAGRAR